MTSQPPSGRSADTPDEIYNVGELRIHKGTHEVWRGDSQVQLSKLSFRLLSALMDAAPNILSTDELMARVWPGRVVSPETITQRVRLLRRALGDDAQSPTYVGLVRGEGYRLLMPVTLDGRSELPKSDLLTELVERRVHKVAAMYIAIAWSLTEALSFVVESLNVFPARSIELIAILFVVGFPVAMFLTWRFDIDRQGGIRVAASSAKGRSTIAAALVLLVGATTALYYVIEPRQPLPDARDVKAFAANTVAVLPFVNATGDDSNLYITQGLGDELRDQLGRIAGLRVAARSSSVFAQSQGLSATDVAQSLGVRWLIESTFRKERDRLRISVQIIDGSTGFQTWSKSFNKLESDLLTAQQQIATDVVARIFPEAANQVERSDVSSSVESANTYMLLARHLEQQVKDQQAVDESMLARSVDLYRKATEADPTSALAHSRLGSALLYSGRVDEAYEPIELALQINSNLSDAHYAKGLYHWSRHEAEAGASYERAVSLNANNADAVSAYAKWLWNKGTVDEAGEFLLLAKELDPLSLQRYADLGNHYGLMNKVPQARQVAREMEQRFPNQDGYRQLARLHELLGEVDVAIEWVMKAKLADPSRLDAEWQLSELYSRIGDVEAAERIEPSASASRLFFSRAYPELIDLAEEQIIEHPNDIQLFHMLAFAYNTQGYFDRTLRLLRILDMPEVVLRDARADGVEVLLTFVGALVGSGQTEEALALSTWLAEYTQRAIDTGGKTAWWPNLYFACAQGYLGEEDLVFEHLERASSSAALLWYPVLRDAECFKPYRDASRYKRVVDAMDERRAALRNKVSH